MLICFLKQMLNLTYPVSCHLFFLFCQGHGGHEPVVAFTGQSSETSCAGHWSITVSVNIDTVQSLLINNLKQWEDRRRKLWQVTQVNMLTLLKIIWIKLKHLKLSLHTASSYSSRCKWFQINARLFFLYLFFYLDVIAGHYDHHLHIMAYCATKTCNVPILLNQAFSRRVDRVLFLQMPHQSLLTALMKDVENYCIILLQEILLSGWLSNHVAIGYSNNLTFVRNKCTRLNSSNYRRSTNAFALVIRI